MRVVILGSGVVGVASAWYLNQAGHEVPSLIGSRGPPWKPAPRMPGKSPPDMLHRGRHQVCL